MIISECCGRGSVELSRCSGEAAGSGEVDAAESAAFGCAEVENVDTGSRLADHLFSFDLHEEARLLKGCST